MRLFIAIPVPDSVKQHARMVRNELGTSRADVKWVEYKNYHLTLKFLGEVAEVNIPLISQNLKLVAENCPAFNLSAGGVGYFPNRNRPRVLWMGIKGELDKARFLAQRVDAYLEQFGYEVGDKHSFHLTLGRFRSDKGKNELVKAADESAAKNKLTAFRVEKFDLMQSNLTSAGPEYEIIESYALKG